MSVATLLTPGSVTIRAENTVKTFLKGSSEYEKAKELIKEENDQGLIDLVNSFKNAVEGASDKFRVEDDVVYVKNADGTEEALPRQLGERLVEFTREGLPTGPILRFWERLRLNPSYDSVQRLFSALEKNRHPLLSDGFVLCWRKVRRKGDKLVDIFTGKVDNSIGQKPRMPRNQVCDDHTVTCSRGYHASTHAYAKNHYGSPTDVMVEVAVDPADFVSIPFDYDEQKYRVCGYEVLRECEEENKENLAKYGDDRDVNLDDSDELDRNFDDEDGVDYWVH
jgi:hypothetical protein